MAGLYVHIPFCKTRCYYCSFYSTTGHGPGVMADYVEALTREIDCRGRSCIGPDKMPGEWTTIYLGGGTPSQLPPLLLRRLMDRIDLRHSQETTIECNPDDISADYARLLVSLGFNRVSMGAQTFDDGRLRPIGRRHTAETVSRAVRILREAGISNLSIDLMYGFPGERLDDWERDIDAALRLEPDHISAYLLTIEPSTPMAAMMTGERDEEAERAMYYMLSERLRDEGYEHYEISNFCRPGRRSLHNSSYWTGEPYIGVGAAAHSYITDGEEARREWNVADVGQYIAGMGQGRRIFDCERLSMDEQYNDAVMLGLRTREGVDLSAIGVRFGAGRLDYLLSNAERWVRTGLLRLARRAPHEEPLCGSSLGGCFPLRGWAHCLVGAPHEEPARLVLTREGLFVSDMVASSLMIV